MTDSCLLRIVWVSLHLGFLGLEVFCCWRGLLLYFGTNPHSLSNGTLSSPFNKQSIRLAMSVAMLVQSHLVPLRGGGGGGGGERESITIFSAWERQILEKSMMAETCYPRDQTTVGEWGFSRNAMSVSACD